MFERKSVLCHIDAPSAQRMAASLSIERDGMTSETGRLACAISSAGSTSAMMKGVLSESGLNCGGCWRGRHAATGGTGVVAIVNGVVKNHEPASLSQRTYDLLLSTHHSKLAPHNTTSYVDGRRCGSSYNFCNIFIALAIAKLDLAITCRLSFVTSGSACVSLSLFAWSLSSRRISPPCCA